MREFFGKRPWLFVVGILLFFVVGNVTVLVVAQSTQGADLAPLSAGEAAGSGELAKPASEEAP